MSEKVAQWALIALLLLSIILGLVSLARSPEGVASTADESHWSQLIAGPANALAIVRIEGPLAYRRAFLSQGGGGADADRVIERLDRLRVKGGIEGVVLWINSSGGTVAATEGVRRAVRRLRDGGLPVVAALGDVAAGGAYLVAAAAQQVIAASGTLTGGLTAAALGGGAADSRTRSQEVLERQVGAWALDIVGRDRELEADRLEAIAAAGLVLGDEAKRLGLVDDLGDRESALAFAAELAGLGGASYEVDDDRPGLLTRLAALAAMRGASPWDARDGASPIHPVSRPLFAPFLGIPLPSDHD